MALSATLQDVGIQLELLTGPLAGIFDPSGMGNMFFAVLAVAAQLDRDCIREKSLEGQTSRRPPAATTAAAPRSSTPTCTSSPAPWRYVAFGYSWASRAR